jgi:hypothetical protein
VPPWQVVQVRPCVSTVPLMCLAPETSTAPVASTVPPWHFEQVVSAAALWWLAVVGGERWQSPQAATGPSHAQLARAPLLVVALSELPWQ